MTTMTGWGIALADDEVPRACPRTLAPRQVLDMHADLQRLLAHPTPTLRAGFTAYAIADVKAGPGWAASHVHPSTTLADLDPWLSSLGFDLAGAATYQVTREMIDLAEALTITTPDLADLQAEDLPSDWGFMWLDRPIPRPSVEDGDRPPLLMHAVSWAKIPALDVRLGDGLTAVMPGLRIREWGWNDAVSIEPRPLHLMGQSTAVLTQHVHTPLTELHLVHMLWILMGMEITAATRVEPDRAGRKRAAGLHRPAVTVITLRRPAHGDAPVRHRHIDWSCSWLVRGHYRNAPHGGTYADGRTRTWVKPHIKGPDGLPLRASDILYKLAR